MNTSDEDAGKYIRIFTLKPQEEILELEKQHAEAPHLRVLQKALAEDITIRVHSQEESDNAIAASNILFGNSTAESLKGLSERDLLSVFEGVPQAEISIAILEEGQGIIDFTVTSAKAFGSNGEARRMIQNNGVSVNKEKVNLDKMVSLADLILDKYVLLQKGKKNYYLITVV